jgi:hypothetical protein
MNNRNKTYGPVVACASGYAGRQRGTFGLPIGTLLILLLFLVGCGTPAPQPLIFNPAPWRNGEVSLYQITDVNGNRAGMARYELNQSADGLWTLLREINAQGGVETVMVEMSEADYRPQQAELIRRDQSGRERVATTYSGSQVDLELTTRGDVTTYERMNIPSDARDQRTLVMLARALPLAQNYATRLNSFLPVVPLLERVTLSVGRNESVSVPAGTFNTWRVTIAQRDSSLQIWVGVDAPYPVVKFVDGRNRGTFELAEFQLGN